ncbi:MAG: RadC family protein [Acidiferrobacterales bacterium]
MATMQPQSTPAFQADDEPGQYRATRIVSESDIINAAKAILAKRHASGSTFESPEAVRDYLMVQLGGLESERFDVLYLDQRHRLIAHETAFNGTINGCAVYPREIVRQAILHNAAAVIFAHNHPSGVAEPSRSDEILTHRLREALTVIDVRTLDHVVVGAGESVSFADRGLI